MSQVFQQLAELGINLGMLHKAFGQREANKRQSKMQHTPAAPGYHCSPRNLLNPEKEELGD